MSIPVTDLKHIVLNVNTPQIIKNAKVPWPCFTMSLEQWCTQFDNSQCEKRSERAIIFETGNRRHSNCPQWEKFRGKMPMTVTEFYRNSRVESEFFKNNWAAFSYKNIGEVPVKCTEGVDFSCFGFPEVRDDVTFWLSSTGAHTPCHYDTYGCNIVVQVYGRKQWQLFPPSAKLTPVRIPYEESSVYCSEAFYSPNSTEGIEAIQNDCYSYILEPGDVLIVPPKWWHYVENLCPSLSINAWIPLKTDIEAQIEECIVRILIRNFIKSDDDFLDVLNPNEIDILTDKSDLFRILQHLIKQKTGSQSIEKHDFRYLSDDEISKILEKYKKDIFCVPKLSIDEFHEVLKQRLSRYDAIAQNSVDFQTDFNLQYQLINSICNPAIINRIKEDFIVNYREPNKQ